MDRGGQTLYQGVACSSPAACSPAGPVIQHLSHPHYSPGVPILSSPKPSEARAIKINNMYFETKTNMVSEAF